ncbi:MAG: hypothetical protein ACON4R_04365 [Akkermansiaceae bacterium]
MAHHNQAHPDMIVNGQSLPLITPGSTFDETIAGFFDSAQQDALAEDVVAPSACTVVAEGDGESLGHSGGNLFDLLGQ